MFSLRYLNRHFFIEHEGRHYLVDTGCPKSFGIHGHVPWADKTPPVVIMDMKEGRLRFHRDENDDFRSSRMFGFEKAPRSGAPILNIRGRSDTFKLIWDTGAQIGYVEIARINEQMFREESGPFRDFSPIYGQIDSAQTWRTKFIFEPDFDPAPPLLFHACCQMAEAPRRLLDDIISDGAQGVIGNSWINSEDGTIVTIKGKTHQLHISSGSWEGNLDFLKVYRPRERSFTELLELLDIDPEPMGEATPDPSSIARKAQRRHPHGPGDDQLSALPTSDHTTGLTPVLRPMPRFIGQFQTETIRGHLGMETIDGLIGNDLLLDTLL